MATRFANPAPQFFYNGTPAAPLVGGLLYFYEAGSSLTPKNTYSDNSLSIPNSNPVVLSSSGVLPNVFLDGPYRVILKSKDGVQQWDRDSINSVSELAYGPWDATINYGVGGTNIVYASNGIYYVSILTPNLGNEPSVSPTYWERAIDYFLSSQTTIEPGHIGVGGDPDGIVSLNTKIKGAMAVGNGTTTTAITVGTNGQVLTADSTAAQGVKWEAPPGAVGEYQEFLVSGTFDVEPNALFVYIEAIGAGAGGGAVQIDGNNARGGGGGEFVSALILTSAITPSVAVTIGAGGPGGPTSSGAISGSNGGTTSFGSYVTARGGLAGGTVGNTNFGDGGGGELGGGRYVSQPSINAGHGNGGFSSGAGGGLSVDAATAGTGVGDGGDCVQGGAGGGGAISGSAGAAGLSSRGGNGGAGNFTLNTKGGNGVVPGGGGGGSVNNGGGGDGANGRVRIWQW